MIEKHNAVVTTIRADSRAYDSSTKAVKQLIKDTLNFKGQILSVYKQNFKNSYYGSGLGVIWNFILPLVPITVYLFLSVIRVVPSFDGVDRASYLTFGVMAWFVFAGFVLTPISIISSRNKDAMKTSMPLIATIVAGFAELTFETFVRILLVLGIMIFMGTWPSWTAPGLLLVFCAAFFLFFGLGLVFGILNVIYRDVGRVVQILLRYGIFLSGVIFPFGNSPVTQLFNILNPFAVFVESSRQIVFKGGVETAMLQTLAIWTAIGFLVFLLGCRLFHVMEHRIRGIL